MDLKVQETGNGGDLKKYGNDLNLVFGFENMPYIAMFGGNVEASTPDERLNNEQAFDWWGNKLFFPDDTSLQLNSETERTLENTPLTSSGRILIEQAVIADLEFMSPFADVEVSTRIVATDVVEIHVNIQEPENLEAKEYIYIWDATQAALLGTFVANPNITGDEELQQELQFNL